MSELIITLRVRRANVDPQGVKEALAMDLEKYGDVQVVSVEERGRGEMEQMQIGQAPRRR